MASITACGVCRQSIYDSIPSPPKTILADALIRPKETLGCRPRHQPPPNSCHQPLAEIHSFAMVLTEESGKVVSVARLGNRLQAFQRMFIIMRSLE